MEFDVWHSQDRFDVRLEWGINGAIALADPTLEEGRPVTAVVVDTLSFTTCVSVAANEGIGVHPYAWDDATAADFARGRRATLAVPRSRARSGQVSLSPASIRDARDVRDVVLPSPNGSAISAALGRTGATVVAACLRNCTAVGDWAAGWMSDTGGAVVLVPAGERWPDHSLRPAVEDLWAIGAVASVLARASGEKSLSEEARMSAATYAAVADRIPEAMAECSSGRELAEKGYEVDVAIAAELDASALVPLLTDGAFRPA